MQQPQAATVKKVQALVGLVTVLIIVVAFVMMMQPSDKQRKLEDLQNRLQVAQTTMNVCQQNKIPFNDCKIPNGVSVGDEINAVEAEMNKL